MRSRSRHPGQTRNTVRAKGVRSCRGDDDGIDYGADGAAAQGRPVDLHAQGSPLPGGASAGGNVSVARSPEPPLLSSAHSIAPCQRAAPRLPALQTLVSEMGSLQQGSADDFPPGLKDALGSKKLLKNRDSDVQCASAAARQRSRRTRSAPPA